MSPLGLNCICPASYLVSCLARLVASGIRGSRALQGLGAHHSLSDPEVSDLPGCLASGPGKSCQFSDLRDMEGVHWEPEKVKQPAVCVKQGARWDIHKIWGVQDRGPSGVCVDVNEVPGRVSPERKAEESKRSRGGSRGQNLPSS